MVENADSFNLAFWLGLSATLPIFPDGDSGIPSFALPMRVLLGRHLLEAVSVICLLSLAAV